MRKPKQPPNNRRAGGQARSSPGARSDAAGQLLVNSIADQLILMLAICLEPMTAKLKKFADDLADETAPCLNALRRQIDTARDIVISLRVMRVAILTSGATRSEAGRSSYGRRRLRTFVAQLTRWLHEFDGAVFDHLQMDGRITAHDQPERLRPVPLSRHIRNGFKNAAKKMATLRRALEDHSGRIGHWLSFKARTNGLPPDAPGDRTNPRPG